MGPIAENTILMNEMHIKENSPPPGSPVSEKQTRHPFETKNKSVPDYVEGNLCDQFVYQLRMCVCVCVCVWWIERIENFNLAKLISKTRQTFMRQRHFYFHY